MKAPRRAALCLALLPALSGCEAVFGPSARMEGTWSYAATSLAGGGWVCEVSGMVLSLQQYGNEFSGSATGGAMECVRGEEDPVVRTFGTQPVVNGRVSGDAVEFDIGTPDWHNRGRIEDGSMSGTSTILPSLAVDAAVTGIFGAARERVAE